MMALKLKIKLLVLALINALVGLAFIVGGCIIIKTYHYTFLSGRAAVGIIFLIVLGVAIIIAAIVGFIGAMKDNISVIMAYIILILLVIVPQVVLLYLDFSSKEFYTERKDYMLATVNDYNHTDITSAWDSIQEKFQCCGAETYLDWIKPLNGTVPDTCCRTVIPECGQDAMLKNEEIHTNGCAEKLAEVAKNAIYIFRTMFLAKTIIELINLIVATLSVFNQKNKEYKNIK